jgi:branched-chain amino acid transport system permease protein
MELLLQRMADGLGSGCIYAALALALVLVFRSTGVVNFAQGEMAMLSTYLVFFLVGAGLQIWVALGVAVVVSFAAGAALERTLIRRVPRTDHLVMIIVMVGLYTAINGIALYVFGSDGRLLPSLFPTGQLALGGVRLPYGTVGALAVLLVVSGALFALFRFTRIGLGLRAVAQSEASSALSGLPVGRLLAVGWGLAAALGAVAGVMVTSLGLFLEPGLMLPVLVYALTAAVVGGFDSPVGAVVAGVLLGLAESLAVGYVPVLGAGLSLAVPFVVLLVVMLVRPAGLLGTRKVARV